VLRERNKLIQYTWPSSDRPSQGISREMETRGKMRQIEVRANSLFYCNRVTWCSTTAHTHIYILPAPLILPQYSRG